MDERIAQMKRLEGEKKMSKVSMKGVIDMHVHTNPDLRLRAYDDFEMMEAGIRVGARAIVLKTHQGTTMDRAYLCNRHNEIVHGKTNNFTMFGSITLNKVVGGINPKAVDVAYENAALNGVGREHYTVRAGDVLSDKGLQKEFGGDYDVIVANIVADVIIALAPQVGRLLKEGGIFLCSGIIDDRADEVREKLIEAGWTIEETRSSEGWFSYLCR